MKCLPEIQAPQARCRPAPRRTLPDERSRPLKYDATELRADGYQAPSWPGQSAPQQLHLDFAVDDLDEAEELILKLGAAKPDFQPGGDHWRVFTDPSGHPFCLTRNPSA